MRQCARCRFSFAMKLRIALALLAVIVVLGGIFGAKALQIRKADAAAAARRPPPVTVATAQAVPETWTATLDAVASLRSFRGITVRAELDGRISRLAFESGAVVREGDVLVELDTSTETAQLAGLEAQARLAALSLDRARELRRTGTNTPADLDFAENTAQQSLAAIEVLRATIAKKRIVAPFSGRLGIRGVNPGQFLNKGDAVVELESADPIYADFGLPQQELTRLQPGLEVRLQADAYPGRTFTGKVETTSPRVRDDTRNVAVRAVFPNPAEALRPGMFARVSVILPESSAVLVLPASAITYSPYGDSVYVVETETTPEGTREVARQRFVEVGPRRGDQTSIRKGLNPGDRVVVAGQMKLRSGAAVRIDNSILPGNEAAPKPAES
ncbi:MAG: efflux RND transporter periplasmic adaptor subunit [Verrucomicrobia bacterium]|nr:efflux RND transporter periplasmic adaptor subunit [Verrucomicrobiota bacterium]